MKKIFVDTNIFIDLIADRKPFSKFAIELFDKAEKNKVNLYTSTHVIATTHYVLKKFIDEKSLRLNLTSLLEIVSLIAVDSDVIKLGLKSKISDFEDAIQVFCTHKVSNIDFIVTRDPKGFKESGLKILAPDEAIKKI